MFEAAEIHCAPHPPPYLLIQAVFSQRVSLYPYKHPSGSALLARETSIATLSGD